jgi:hypothetical protein
LTQDVLAKALGLKYSQEIAAIETGLTAFPFERVSLLSKALGISKEKAFSMVVKTKEEKFREQMNRGEKKHKSIDS